MSSMVEAVARAILKARFYDQEPDAYGNSLKYFYDSVYPEHGDDVEADARAAIEAMSSGITVEEARRAKAQWAFRLAYIPRSEPFDAFEAGYRMGARRFGLECLEADDKVRLAALSEDGGRNGG